MASGLRKPFQGVGNIIRFNWHYYFLSAVMVLSVFVMQHQFNLPAITSDIALLLIICPTLFSLFVSTYIYDFSRLYSLSWLKEIGSRENEKILNINAGFDETSVLLKAKFPTCELIVADFYDPAKHTEISVKRARRAYPPLPNTQQVNTTRVAIEDESADKIFIFFAAHEVRNKNERIVFFNELRRILQPAGKLIVTEHLRDTANFFAYNIGFFHFYTRATWQKIFLLSGLKVSREIKTTPFITTFILEKNGPAS